jgi:HrpA-like RNA helicase
MESFPVNKNKHKILFGIIKYKIVLILAETGSGKTIFIPHIIFKANLFRKIIISQTRRIAAISAAKFSSHLFNSPIGNIYGYAVRFDDITTKSTKIKFVTDGILFQEILSDPSLSRYSCILIDEFHERTIYTDIILTLMKKILQVRKDLKLILMSATGNSVNIANFFGYDVGKIYIPGKIFKVKIFYTLTSQGDYITSTCSLITKLHFTQYLPGDILSFLPGFEEIEEAFLCLKKILYKETKKFFLFKLHGSIDSKKQNLPFFLFPETSRKIILSTNIAESSLTIPGTKFIVDCGLSKQSFINWESGVNFFRILPISKSEAIQRSGRAGREKNGKCYRLFTWQSFTKLAFFQKPEIQRTKIDSVVLNLISMNIYNILDLDFIDVPAKWIIKRSFEFLFILGAIDDNLCLTIKGKLFSIFPLDVKISRTLVEAIRTNDNKTIDWVIAGASLLSMHTFSKSIKMKKIISENISKKGNVGDNFIFAKFFLLFQKQKTIKKAKKWCQQKNFDFFYLTTAMNLKKQLFIVSKLIFPYFKNIKSRSFFPDEFTRRFNYCFSSGFFINSATRNKETENFNLLNSGLIVHIKYSFYSLQKLNKTVIFDEIFGWKKIFVNGLFPVKFSWILEQGYFLFK